MIGLETESGLGLLVGGRLARIDHGWVSPMFGSCWVVPTCGESVRALQS
jgi:hypothetical protein